MEPLQLMAMMATGDARQHATSALPNAPKVPYREPRPARTPIVRGHLAGLLRRTADRVDPCLEPNAI
jgi:hypothetical protein